jgi:antirestriction protein ArdC
MSLFLNRFHSVFAFGAERSSSATPSAAPPASRVTEEPAMNVYEVITARIVEMLEQGTIPWRKPWRTHGSEPRNLISGKPYRGINILLLSSMGFASPWWLTYRQAMQRGGCVKKGSKGCPVVFWRWPDRDGEDDAEQGEARSRRRAPVIRYFTLFSAEQCEGIETPAAAPVQGFEPIAECERIIRTMPNPPRIEHGGAQAFYRPSTDTITLPRPEQFESRELYYSVLWHEAVHASGSASRLARKGITDAAMFGSHLYGSEELVAEMGAAMLCGTAGIEAATLKDSTAYLASWIKVLKGDARLAVTAGSQAQKAVDWILGRSETDVKVDVAA